MQPLPPKRNIARENLNKRRDSEKLDRNDAPKPTLKSLCHASMIRDHEIAHKVTPDVMEKITPTLNNIIETIDKYISDLEKNPTTKRPEIYNVAIDNTYADAFELVLIGSGYKVKRGYFRSRESMEKAIAIHVDPSKTFFYVSWIS